MNRRRFALPALAATALLLAACTPAEFAREQTPEDRPDAVVAASAGEVDVDSLRYVGKADDFDVYFSRGADDEETLCLSLVLDGEWQSTACGRGNVSARVSDSASVNAAINYPQGGQDPEKLSDNVWVSRK